MNKQSRQELFLDMMEETFKDQPINESYQDFDEALAIYEAVEEFFVENYRHLTIEEEVVAVVRGIDVNEELVDVIVELMLDESIGSAIATVVHGIGQYRAQKKADKAGAEAERKTSIAGKAAARAGGAALKAKKAEKSQNSLVGRFKAAHAQGRADKARNVAKKTYAQGAAARSRAAQSSQTLAAKQQKRAGLASTFDTKIQKAKDAVKSGVKTAASKVGHALGRFL